MMRNIQTREGFEFWDKLNALPRYAFLLSPSGKSVQKFEDQAMGNWIDVHEAQKVVDQAEERINDRQDELREVNRQLEQFRERCHGIKNLSAIESRDDQLAVAQLKINELQQRLNAADQRVDELGKSKELLREAYNEASPRLPYRIRQKIEQFFDGLVVSISQDAEVAPIKGMIEAVGGKYAIMIDQANSHYGWIFKKDPNGMWVSGRKATDAEIHAARTYAHITNQQ